MPKGKSGKETVKFLRRNAPVPGRSNFRPCLRGPFLSVFSVSSCEILPFFQSSRFKVQSSKFRVRCSDAESALSESVQPSPTKSNQIKPPHPLPVKKSVKKRSSFWLFLTTRYGGWTLVKRIALTNFSGHKLRRIMEQVAHSTAVPIHPEPTAEVSASRTATNSSTDFWPSLLMTVALSSIAIGITWDISWHETVGRDTFWTPAHMAIYLGGVLGGCVGGWLAFKHTFRAGPAERDSSVSVFGARAPLGAWVAIWGALAMVTSAPFDDWWHNAYGLDVKIVSPPHAVLGLGMLGISVGALLLLLSRQNRLQDPSPFSSSSSSSKRDLPSTKGSGMDLMAGHARGGCLYDLHVRDGLDSHVVSGSAKIGSHLQSRHSHGAIALSSTINFSRTGD